MRCILPSLSAALTSVAPYSHQMPERGVGPIANTVQPAPSTAAQAPVPEPVSAATNPYPEPSTGSDAAARGRRVLSTAFVRIGPDGHLFVELRDKRVLVLRDVTMGATEFCGTQMASSGMPGTLGKRQCYDYAGVIAARPGDVATGGTPVPAGPES